FNALLKTLEEPPPHVKFLLATTDPQKLPVTVLSRCLQFNLTRLTPRLIHDRLAKICEAEGIAAESPALAMIARAADGSLRDALSLLDQAIAYCAGKVEEAPVSTMLGTIDRDHVARLIKLLAADDAPGIVDAIEEIDQQFPDYSRLHEDLARVLQRIAVYQVVGGIETDDEISDEQLAELAEILSPADVQLFYQTALIGRRDLHLAPDPKCGTEMTLLRMLAFRPAQADMAGTAGGSGASKSVSQATVSETTSRVAPVKPVKVASESAGNWQDPNWSELITELELSGSVKMLASNCAFLRRDGNTVFLSIDPRSESLLTRDRKQALCDILSEHFREALTVDISIGEAVVETPVQEESRLADERVEAERVKLESDPNVQALKDLFGAELKADSIELINPSQSD
ncbi:MAG: DNA polymerase III subunit gamma/tau, partial [Gammaproteobacteria bacterium]|nr:DNA polymerase III subunit gamma/tau [Gammaproteobacteria bacterium]